MSSIRYPALHHFLSTEFIQDSEDTRTLDQIATAFASAAGPAKAQAVAADIDRLLEAHPTGLEAAFAKFDPQIDPAADGHTAESWLRAVASSLAKHKTDKPRS